MILVIELDARCAISHEEEVTNWLRVRTAVESFLVPCSWCLAHRSLPNPVAPWSQGGIEPLGGTLGLSRCSARLGLPSAAMRGHVSPSMPMDPGARPCLADHLAHGIRSRWTFGAMRVLVVGATFRRALPLPLRSWMRWRTWSEAADVRAAAIPTVGLESPTADAQLVRRFLTHTLQEL